MSASTALHSAIYPGRVTHQRLQPLRHRLGYRMVSFLFDLDELPALHQASRWFSLGRFNLFSLHPADHDPEGHASLRAAVADWLSQAGLQADGRVLLLTMPRVLGLAFNPLSVYFCHDAAGALRVVIYEVNNTFGDRHRYLVEVEDAQSDGSHVRQACDKAMHVSPFMPMAMRYRFALQAPDRQRAGLDLGVSVWSAGEPGAPAPCHLHAALRAQRRDWSDAELLRAAWRHPLLALQVLGAIHWEAWKLWRKGLPFFRRPEPVRPTSTVVLVHHP